MRLSMNLIGLLTRLIAAAGLAPGDLVKERAAAEMHRAMFGDSRGLWDDSYPNGTATQWHPPVGAFYRRGAKARWKHLRRVRG